MSRELEKKINEYNIPDGYTIEIRRTLKWL
jgi:hypothetical protein